jgi:hypothetical protein
VERLDWTAVGGSVAVAAGNRAVDARELNRDREGEVVEIFAGDVKLVLLIRNI